MCAAYSLSSNELLSKTSDIPALILTSCNIEVFIYFIHQVTTNFPQLSEGSADISNATFHKSPPEIGMKMRSFLKKRCNTSSQCPVT
jgi:hypothetical protein